MASGTGLNRYGNAGGAIVLQLNPNSAIVTSPLTAYGTIGSNDSGVVGVEGIGMTKWCFQLVALPGTTSIAGYTVTLYGTVDSRAYGQWEAAFDPARYQNQVQGVATPVCPASSWFVLPAPSEQGGTGVVTNPITPTNPILNVSMPLVAVRAVLTAVSTPAGGAGVSVFAVP